MLFYIPGNGTKGWIAIVMDPSSVSYISRGLSRQACLITVSLLSNVAHVGVVVKVQRHIKGYLTCYFFFARAVSAMVMAWWTKFSGCG